MPYCPKCKKEYGNETEICPECGEKLTDDADVKEELLISANEGYAADLIEGSLKNSGIPYHRKSHGGPAGFSRYDYKYESLGADFFVPQNLLERAKEVLPPVDEPGSGKEPENNGVESESPENPAPVSAGKRVVSAVIFILLAALVIFGVDFVMNIIRKLMGYN